MTRLNIAQLPIPSDQYRPDLLARSGLKRFETEEKARVEDRMRSKLLLQAAELAKDPENAAAARELSNRLDYGSESPPASISSSLHMREQRIRIGGALIRLADQCSTVDIATFHLTPANAELRGNELVSLDPRKACAALVSDCNRHSISNAGGGIFAFLDGEYEPTSDVWRPHFHGLAVGDKVGALEALRGSRKYRSVRCRNKPGRSVQRVRILRKLNCLPYHLPYLVKSFWPSRWEGEIEGKHVRPKRRSRIPEPRHSQMLLWMDRWRLQDLCVLIGLHAGSDGLRLT